MSDITTPRTRAMTSHLPDIPLVIWMVILAIGMGFYSGLSAPELIREFNTGFGSALGEFALILLPSFTLAAALSCQSATPAKGLAATMSPIAGAGMVCPDTAYAALSPIAGRQKLDVAFGSYAGFKLLFPAGPLIVATGLGVADPPCQSMGWFCWRRFGVAPCRTPTATRGLFGYCRAELLRKR